MKCQPPTHRHPPPLGHCLQQPRRVPPVDGQAEGRVWYPETPELLEMGNVPT